VGALPLPPYNSTFRTVGALAGALAEERGTCCIGFRKRFSKRGTVARGSSRTGVYTSRDERSPAPSRERGRARTRKGAETGQGRAGAGPGGCGAGQGRAGAGPRPVEGPGGSRGGAATARSDFNIFQPKPAKTKTLKYEENS
jgi:hypothetical protein